MWISLGHFERHRKAFFIFLLAMLASSILKEAVLEHRLPSPLNLDVPPAALLRSLSLESSLARRSAQFALALFGLTRDFWLMSRCSSRVFDHQGLRWLSPGRGLRR